MNPPSPNRRILPLHHEPTEIHTVSQALCKGGFTIGPALPGGGAIAFEPKKRAKAKKESVFAKDPREQ
jgi:hypothetical protein